MSELAYYKSRKPFLKIDAFVIFIGLILFLCTLFLFLPTSVSRASIYVDGVLFGSYTLDENRTLSIGAVKIEIDENGIQITESDCLNKVCVHIGAISSAHQVIVCAPNKIVILMTGEDKYDVVIGGMK